MKLSLEDHVYVVQDMHKDMLALYDTSTGRQVSDSRSHKGRVDSNVPLDGMRHDRVVSRVVQTPYQGWPAYLK